MNLFRKLLALLLVLGVAAYALPASAQNNVKRAYALVMSPGTLNAGQAGQSMNAAVQNVSPDGISTIRSFKLAVTGAGIKITGATVGSPFAGTVTIDPVAGAYVTVDSIQPPVKPFDPVSGTLNLALTVQTQCSYTGATWALTAYTGTPTGSGQTFVLSPTATSIMSTGLGTPCSVQLTTNVNPTDATNYGASVSCSNVTVGSTSGTCTATAPTYQYAFTSWSGNCSGSGTTCNLPNPLGLGPYTVTANYTAYTINKTITGKGTVGCGTVSTINGQTTCTATPTTVSGETWIFKSWGGDCGASNTSANQCTLTMTGNKSITATFVQTFTVTGAAVGSGSVSCDPSVVESGGSSTCTATTSNSFLTGFSANCSRIGTTNQCTISNVLKDETVTGTFATLTGTQDCGFYAPDTSTAPSSGTTNPDQPGYAKAFRGKFNVKDPSCVLVAFSFTNAMLQATKSGSNVWDVAVQASATWYYTLNGYAKDLTFNGDGTPVTPTVNPPKVKWGSMSNYKYAQTCLGSDLPRPYGALSTALGATQTPTATVTLDLSTPPSYGPNPINGGGYVVPPASPAVFPITIDGERMNAQVSSYVAGSQLVLNVTRAQGGTAAADHSVGKYALSTPLPLGPGGNSVDLMCVTANGYQVYNQNQWFQTFELIDAGDGGWAIE